MTKKAKQYAGTENKDYSHYYTAPAHGANPWAGLFYIGTPD